MPRYLKALPQIYTCEVYRSIQKLATTRRCHKQPVVNWGLLATSSCEDSFFKKNWYTESGIPSKLEGAHVRNSCLEKISKTTATKKLHLLFGRIFPLILGWFCWLFSSYGSHTKHLGSSTDWFTKVISKLYLWVLTWNSSRKYRNHSWPDDDHGKEILGLSSTSVFYMSKKEKIILFSMVIIFLLAAGPLPWHASRDDDRVCCWHKGHQDSW